MVGADDLWHSPTSDHPHWTETSYWGFYIPERRLSGTIYNMWRKNLGLVASRVWLWDDDGDLPNEVLYTKVAEHVTIPDGADPTNFELPTGLSCERIAALESHRFRYADGDVVTFDLVTEALRPPTAAFGGAAPGTGHFDQHIRVTGSIRLWGEELAVDCFSMRDRTWSMRSDYLNLNLLNGYMHATLSADDCWLAMASSSPPDTNDQAIAEGAGCLVIDGRAAMIVGGHRRVTGRRRGRPEQIEVQLRDSMDRTLEVEGEALNHLGALLNPAIFNWFSLYRWTYPDGRVAFGEDQETWIPPTEFRRTINAEREGG